MSAPSVIVFVTTLSDVGPMSGRSTDIERLAGLATTWFAQVLRDGCALPAVAHVLEGFTSLHGHPDVTVHP